MLEIPIPISDFIREVRQTIPHRTDRQLSTGEYEIDHFPGDASQTAEEISNKYNVKYIGCGKDSIVVVCPTNPDLLYKVPWNDYDMSPEKAKQIYYLHKLASTVFPANIPAIHAAFGVIPRLLHPRYHPGFIVKRVTKARDYNSYSDGFFPDLYSRSRELGIPIDFDGGGFGDVIWGTDGNPYYLDQVYISGRSSLWQPAKLYIEMEKNSQYTKSHIKIAPMCINRLAALGVISIVE